MPVSGYTLHLPEVNKNRVATLEHKETVENSENRKDNRQFIGCLLVQRHWALTWILFLHPRLRLGSMRTKWVEAVTGHQPEEDCARAASS